MDISLHTDFYIYINLNVYKKTNPSPMTNNWLLFSFPILRLFLLKIINLYQIILLLRSKIIANKFSNV